MKKTVSILLLVFSLMISGLSLNSQAQGDSLSFFIAKSLNPTQTDTSEIERIFIANNLIDIQLIDSTFLVDLIYSSTNNFIGIDFYGDLKKAYLQRDVAEKLIVAKRILEKEYPALRLKIYDATRPLSIQQMMWDSIKVPADQKEKYLANPKFGSLHNYGAAVDLVLVDTLGNTIDMGTKFDSFEKLSYPILEDHFLKTKELTREQLSNRLILRNTMKKAGFNHIPTEWWHYSTCSRDEASVKYAMIISHQLPQKTTPSNLIAEENKEEQIIESRINKNIHVTFRVQILSSAKRISKKHPIYSINEGKTEEYFHEGYYKYTIGEFIDLGKAHELQFKMWELGYKDAFVAGFNNNERISIHDAIELLEFQ